MKIRVSFKTPDAVNYVVTNYIESLDPPDPKDADFDDYEDDPEGWFSEQADTLKTFFAKWIRYGELVTLEFDTEANTAVVVKATDWLKAFSSVVATVPNPDKK